VPSTLEKVLKFLGRKGGHKVVRAGLGDQLKASFEYQIQLLNSFNDPRTVYARLSFDVEIP
jgi:hypothetical protein